MEEPSSIKYWSKVTEDSEEVYAILDGLCGCRATCGGGGASKGLVAIEEWAMDQSWVSDLDLVGSGVVLLTRKESNRGGGEPVSSPRKAGRTRGHGRGQRGVQDWGPLGWVPKLPENVILIN